MKAKFILTGITPILLHADDVEWSDTVKAWQQEPDNKEKSKAGDDRTPPWLWWGSTYRNAEGNAATPSMNLTPRIRPAASKIIMKGNKTYKEIAASEINFGPTEFLKFTVKGKEVAVPPLDRLLKMSFAKQAELVKTLGFKLDVRRASIKNNKHIRVRPRFETWEVSGDVFVEDAELITKERLTQIFDLSGKVGLGDWRPGCKTPGPFGMFKASLKF